MAEKLTDEQAEVLRLIDAVRLARQCMYDHPSFAEVVRSSELVDHGGDFLPRITINGRAALAEYEAAEKEGGDA